jgi:hypothetical protein
MNFNEGKELNNSLPCSLLSTKTEVKMMDGAEILGIIVILIVGFFILKAAILG